MSKVQKMQELRKEKRYNLSEISKLFQTLENSVIITREYHDPKVFGFDLELKICIFGKKKEKGMIRVINITANINFSTGLKSFSCCETTESMIAKYSWEYIFPETVEIQDSKTIDIIKSTVKYIKIVEDLSDASCWHEYPRIIGFYNLNVSEGERKTVKLAVENVLLHVYEHAYKEKIILNKTL